MSSAQRTGRRAPTRDKSSPHRGQPLLQVGDIEFDQKNALIRRAGRNLRLSPTEFRVFALLISNPGRPYSREDLIKLVWRDGTVDIRTVDVTISRLRKVVTWGWHLDPIKSVHGRGYKFCEDYERQYSEWLALGRKKLVISVPDPAAKH